MKWGGGECQREREREGRRHLTVIRACKRYGTNSKQMKKKKSRNKINKDRRRGSLCKHKRMDQRAVRC